MGYLNYRRRHTVQYSHYRNVRERWTDFKHNLKIFSCGLIVGAVIVLVIVGQHK